MRASIAAILVLSVALLLGLSSTFVFAAQQPAQGFVTYNVTVGHQGSSEKSFVVNESSVSTSKAGFDLITVSLMSGSSNLTYSKDLNVSALPEVFPFLPGVNNQSFSYQTHGVSISASIVGAGSSSVTFNGKSYQLSSYHVSITASNSSSGQSVSAKGNVTSLPSGLVYSVAMEINSTYSANLQLLATNLPLNDPSTSTTSTTVGVVAVSAGVFGAAALAVPSMFRRRSARKAEQESQDKEGDGTGQKPSYWVD